MNLQSPDDTFVGKLPGKDYGSKPTEDKAVLAERERAKAKIRPHLSRTTMSVYGTQAECKAARDALQRLLDDEG